MKAPLSDPALVFLAYQGAAFSCSECPKTQSFLLVPRRGVQSSMQITLLSAKLTFSTFFFRARFKEKITFLLGRYAKSLDPDDFPIYAVLLRWALYWCETMKSNVFAYCCVCVSTSQFAFYWCETKKI